MRFVRVLFITGLSALAFGCATSSRVPRSDLTNAKTAISTAEGAGAERQPQAALHLKMARDQVSQAERLIADGKHESAGFVLMRAKKDAELALALTQEAKAQAEAQEALDRIAELQTQNDTR